MPIIGITHNEDRSVRIRRTVMGKVAIGLPPREGSNYPSRLDHFIIQRKATSVDAKGKREVTWIVDEEKMEAYGKDCRELWIVILDDDPDVVFRTEYAYWTKTQCVCRGDGLKAWRKTKEKPEGADYAPCAMGGCPEPDHNHCSPSGDLYFILADFPTLGTIYKLHTSSYQSIREIRSALEDLRSVTGGRLMGVKVKLFVREERNSYRDAKTKELKTSTKQVIGLELAAQDIRALTGSMVENMRVFDTVRKQLGARSVVIEADPEDEIASDLTSEFYPANAITPAPESTIPSEQGEVEGAQWVRDRHPGLKDERFGVKDDKPIGRSNLATVFYQEWSRTGHKPEAVRDKMEDVFNSRESVAMPRNRFPQMLRWASEPIPSTAPAQTEDEIRAREAFASVGMDMVEQAEIISMFPNDWSAIRQEIGRRVDAHA